MSEHVTNKTRTPLPSALRDAWKEQVLALARYPKKHLDNPKLLWTTLIGNHKDHMVALREVYNQDRAHMQARRIQHQGEVVSYLLGFHLPNLSRLHQMWTRAEARYAFKTLKSKYNDVCVFDIGAGTGSMSQVMLHQLRTWGWADQRIMMRLFDQSTQMLSASEKGLEAMAFEGVVRTIQSSTLQIKLQDKPNTLHIFMMGYMWNETAHQPALRQHLMQILAKSSATRPTMVVVLEPAIYEVARDAMMLRDVLVQKGLKPLYPCSHGLTCPMQARPKDFCYSEFAADLGHIQNHIDKAAGITRKMLAASCYIFANVDVLPLQDQRPMVVGRPLQKDAAHPKTYDYLLCSEGGITKRPGDLLPRPRGTAHR